MEAPVSPEPVYVWGYDGLGVRVTFSEDGAPSAELCQVPLGAAGWFIKAQQPWALTFVYNGSRYVVRKADGNFTVKCN